MQPAQLRVGLYWRHDARLCCGVWPIRHGRRLLETNQWRSQVHLPRSTSWYAYIFSSTKTTVIWNYNKETKPCIPGKYRPCRPMEAMFVWGVNAWRFQHSGWQAVFGLVCERSPLPQNFIMVRTRHTYTVKTSRSRSHIKVVGQGQVIWAQQYTHSQGSAFDWKTILLAGRIRNASEIIVMNLFRPKVAYEQRKKYTTNPKIT